MPRARGLGFFPEQRVNMSLHPTGLTACQKRSRFNTNSHDRMSDCALAALRFTHGHFDSRLPAPQAQPTSSEAGDAVCQGGHVAAVSSRVLNNQIDLDFVDITVVDQRVAVFRSGCHFQQLIDKLFQNTPKSSTVLLSESTWLPRAAILSEVTYEQSTFRPKSY